MKFNCTIKLFLSFALVALTLSVHAQPFSNSWINYNQQYFKIKVPTTGVYRITYSTLVNSSFPISSIDPRNIQIFHKGVEQYIHIHNTAQPGVFDPEDYIEFFGQKNDGWFDEQLFKQPDYHTNPNHSLYNDTAVYFLTWSSGFSNRRFSVEQHSGFDAYTPAPYYWANTRNDYTSSYNYGVLYFDGKTDPEFVQGEGWTDPPFGISSFVNKNISASNVYQGGPDALIKTAITSSSRYGISTPPYHDHNLRISIGNQLIDTLYTGYGYYRFQLKPTTSELINGLNVVTYQSVDVAPSNVNNVSYNRIVFLDITYPRMFSMENISKERLRIPESTGDKTLLEFSNIDNGGSDSVFLYNFSKNKRITLNRQSDKWRAFLQNEGIEHDCYLFGSQAVTLVSKMFPVNYDPFNYARFVDYGSPSVTHANYLIITHPSLEQEVAAYRDYRASTGHKPLLVNIEQLYDQFAYGIGKHPQSITNYLKFALARYDSPPEYLFLVGKSLKLERYRYSTTNYKNTLVPSAGNPPSDILLSAGLDGDLYKPALATGRLSARTPYEVYLYFEKVKEYELAQQNPQEWMKHVLHFGGGSNISQQSVIENYLNVYKQTLEGVHFGGKVTSFWKASTDPIEFTTSDSLRNRINSGVSFMTFFAHGAGAIGFDIDIGEPSDYNNMGKYPILVANSCLTGDMFEISSTSTEQWVLVPDRGVVGYISTVTRGLMSQLHAYSDEFFKNVSTTNYNKSIGKCMQNTVLNIQDPNNFNRKEICLTMSLHGDPAIIPNSSKLPDYTGSPEMVFTTPAIVSSEIDTFTLNVVSLNLGKAVSDSFFIRVERTFPDPTIPHTSILWHGPSTLYKDTIQFRIAVDRINGIGLNGITIYLDASYAIAESNEANNIIQYPLYIYSADIIPIYPPEFAVIPDNTVTLKASTGNPFAALSNYIFEIDTTDIFNSPLKLSTVVSQTGGVVTWTPPLILSDCTVYYWRVSPDSVSSGEYAWRQSSFQYIQGKKGWGQSHFFQYDKNKYRYVNNNRNTRTFDFVNDIKEVTAQTGYYPHINWPDVWARINGSEISTWMCQDGAGHGVKIIVFAPPGGDIVMDTTSGVEYGYWGNYKCVDRIHTAFDFFASEDTTLTNKYGNFINHFPDGYRFLIMSHRNHFAENYSEYLYQAFESIGSAYIRDIPNNISFIIFGTKGSPPGSATEVKGNVISDIVYLIDTFHTNWNEGYIQSTMVGPASTWGSMHWETFSIGSDVGDSVKLFVTGINLMGSEDTLIRNLPRDSADIYDLASRISAAEYPYLKLITFFRDDSLRTSPQLRRWHILYEGIPETAIDPSAHFIFYKDTLNEGDNVSMSLATRNISEYDMDSLLISYWIEDRHRVLHKLPYVRKREHPAEDILIDTVSFNTTGFAGNNALWVEFNPVNPSTGLYDQLELFHYNNLARIPFHVVADKINPMLDITFDGIHILDGDIVSARPEIAIFLKDENRFLYPGTIADTSIFRVYLKSPGEEEAKRIFFFNGAEEVMRFEPATLPENVCKILYNPVFTEDGVYTLIVHATDVSRNRSGDNAYSINFEVVNTPAITNVLNWPNPFSTRTHFVFTLTGHEIPEDLRIVIMTISGKVVRVIDRNELGPLHIGRNITTYAWDGTDEFGDRLANGVYLYRVIVHLRGEEMEKISTGADKYIKHGFGKMYLLR